MSTRPVDSTKLVTKSDTTNKPVLNLSQLDAQVRNQVKNLNRELVAELAVQGQSRVRLGEIFSRGRQLLEPMGLFTAWVNSTPVVSDTTAYRLIAEYEASKTFPKAVLEVAAVSGIRIVGASDEKPYGRYTDVVQKIGEPTKNWNQEQSALWLQKVVHTYNQERLAKRKSPLMLGEAVTFAQRWVVKLASKIPEQQRVEFLREVLDKSMTELGVKMGAGIRNRLVTTARHPSNLAA